MALGILRSNRGFTLLESLIVLTVVSAVLLFGIITVNPAMEWMQKRMFVSQLKADLYHAHSHAINRKERVSVSFSKGDNRYSATGESSGVLFIRDVPHPVKITGGSLSQLRFHITPDGTINHFGVVNFVLDDHPIDLTFHIGRGRFVVKE
ncbi:competence type IV pilus minor pilin ComGD [Siminovitchia fortis]|uniref:Prepilin-type N-terminal cleavage/methylation domain-containing protein n=1 Tax=Siminovitchia fortis TaxID=254758 RepID=A0A443J3R4_9BACI|nr:competence type IV pilus minor pilin ComGD [Siminovitchia fortis]RWR15112.1 prepilin-type N-terminal cleavage/methylation domain-containing protein [Siminovitchia fortis]WHY82750.1 competence type IV pilus minor pilin ComGD [Siminovitchia fortis]